MDVEDVWGFRKPQKCKNHNYKAVQKNMLNKKRTRGANWNRWVATNIQDKVPESPSENA